MPIVQNPSIGAGAVPMLFTVTALSQADILALNTVPKTLVPAPAAGFIIVVFGVAMIFHVGSALYHSAVSDNGTVQYSGTDNDSVCDVFHPLVDQAGSGNMYNSGSCDAPSDILPGNDAQAIELVSDSSYEIGPILTTSLGAGGLGYAANDTGTITTGNGDATYKVLTVGAGGAVLTYSITAAGTGYVPGNGQATATGGAQPGVGVGFTVNVLTVTVGNGTLKVYTYYQIIPVP